MFRTQQKAKEQAAMEAIERQRAQQQEEDAKAQAFNRAEAARRDLERRATRNSECENSKNASPD